MQGLGEDDTHVEKFNVQVSDGHGGTEVQTIEVTINGTNDAPVVADFSYTESNVGNLGLSGKFFAYDNAADGASVDNQWNYNTALENALKHIDSHTPDATFIANTIDFAADDGTLNSFEELQDFIGSQGHSVVEIGDGGFSGADRGIMQMEGAVKLEAGMHQFKVYSDDGFQIKIDGEIVGAHTTDRAPGTTLVDFSVENGGYHTIEIVYWDQGGRYVLQIEDSVSTDGGTSWSDFTPLAGNDLVQDANGQLQGAVTEDVASSISGTLTFTDIDAGDEGNAEVAGSGNLTYAVSDDGVGEYGSLTYNEGTGEWIYTLAEGSEQQLDAGVNGTEVFTITATDGAGESVSQTITVIVTGTNDAPVVAEASTADGTPFDADGNLQGAVTEDAASSISGTLTFTDIDAGDEGNAEVAGSGNLTYAVSDDGVGEYGSLTYDEGTGEWIYTLAEGSEQQLDAGVNGTEVFTITATDAAGESVSQTITVTVNGTNDAPVVAEASTADGTPFDADGNLQGAVTEDAASSVSGTLTFTDIDTGDEGNAEVTGSGNLTYSVSDNGVGEYGSLTYDEATGEWAYTLTEGTEQQLDAGVNGTEVFTITATDAAGESVSQTITVTVNGTNDAPVVAEATNSETGQTFADGQDITGTVTETGHWNAGDDSATGTLTFTDPDGKDEGNAEVEGSGSLTYEVSSDLNTSSSDLYDQNDSQNNDTSLEVVGKYGNLTYDTENGTWTYTLDNDREATKELVDGQEVHESFTVVATDDAGASVEKVIDIDVNGSTDLTEYTLTFEGQQASWTNALVVAVTYPDGTTEFVAPGVNSDSDSWLTSDWSNSKDIDEGSTLQFTVREDATVEYFLIPKVTEDKLDSMTYEDGSVKYTKENGDTVDAVSNMKVPGEEYGTTDSTTYRFEDGGGTDYNDFVFSEDKQDADFTLYGTTKADILHGTTEADVLNGGPELGGVESSELLPDGSFDALGADSDVRSRPTNGSENADLNSNGWSTESSLEVWHRGDGEDRNYFVELDSNTHKGSNHNYRESDLSRDIATEAGQEYTLSFKAAARDSGENMYVIIDGQEYEVSPSDYQNNDSSDWDTYSITFTAKDSSTHITLGQHGSQNTGQHHVGILVDDIAVTTGDAGDELYGHAGNDTLNGGLGDDLLVGGAGADTLMGGEGFDTASYAGDNGGEGITIVKSDDGLAISGGDATGDSIEGVEALIGTDHRDVITLDNAWKDIDAGKGMDVVEINDSDGINGVHVDLGEGGIISGTGSGAEIAKFVSDQAINATADGGAGFDSLEVDKEGALSAVITTATTDGEGFNALVTAADGTEIQGENFEQLKFNSASQIDVTIKDNVEHVDLYTAEDKVTETTITSESNVGKISVTTGDEADTVTIQDQGGSFDKELDLHTWIGDDEVTVSGNNVTGSIDTGVGGDTIDLSGVNTGEVTVNSGDDSDTIYAGAAQEIINGGGASDTVSYAKSDVGVTVDLVGENNEGTGDAQGDSYNSIESFVGSGQADTFFADIADTHSVDGGAGIDTIDYSQSYSGVKLVASGSDWSVSENVIGASITGTIEDFENFVGTDQADSVTMTGVNSSTVAFSTGGGGDDFDLSVTNSGNITVDAGAGENDIALAGVNSGNFTVSSGVENDDIDVNMVNSGNLTINAGDGDNDIDVVATNSGNLIVNTGVGSDTISLDGVSSGNATINSGSGDDEIDLTGMTSGSVTVNAGDGSDTMLAGAATETFNGGSDGASGDTVSYAASESSVNVDLSDANNDGIADVSGNGGDAAGDSYSGIENIIGTAHADTLTGNSSNNVIHGGDGAEGRNLITNGDFSDWGSTSGSNQGIPTGWTVPDGKIDGRAHDYVEVQSPDANPKIDYGNSLSQNINTVEGHEYTLAFTVRNDSNSAGQDNELNVHIGNATGEDLDGGTYTTTSTTSSGWTTHTVTFVAGAGGMTSISFDQIGASHGNEDHWGIYLDNVSVVPSLDDTIHGGGGDDIINGQSGNDLLFGDEGADVINGGIGNDVIEGGSGTGLLGDTINGGTGIDTASYEHSAAGVTVDLLNHTASGGDATGDTLTSIENLIGSGQADTLIGDAHANTIDGGAGADTIHGGAGNDVLYGGDGAVSSDLVTNGDFSTFTNGSSHYGDHPEVNSDGNWNKGELIEIGKESNGNFFAEVDNYGPERNITQSIDTDSDHEYILTFDTEWYGRGEKMFLDVDGDHKPEYIVKGPIEDDWQHQALVFDGQGENTVLDFYQKNNSDGNHADGVHIDNVSVVEVDDHLYGNEGEDVLNGGAGNDILNGGADADTFLFTAHDFQTSNEITVIEDFNLDENDTLDFHEVLGDGISISLDDSSSFETLYNKATDTAVVNLNVSNGDVESSHMIVFQDITSSDEYYDLMNHVEQMIKSGS
ncbi:Bifunctional hemolysin/adenylate cyclase [Halodesulfovibrio sp. MK-HDV]|nr:Bifunctional hemolysin/adenylate cyclase [Halodesulfovibrio sp. MK-HDV]